MNVERPIDEAMARAAASLRNAKSELSAREMQEIALRAVVMHDTLAQVRAAAVRARDLGGALEPESLIRFIDEDIVNPRETADGQVGA